MSKGYSFMLKLIQNSKFIFIAACALSWFSIESFAQTHLPELDGRKALLMDMGWRFHLGNAASAEKDFGFGPGWMFAKSGAKEGPLKTDFNDSSWRRVDLPHDWAVELDFVKDEAWQTGTRGFKPLGRDFPETSIGWYRKAFVIPSSEKGKRFELHFDGVFRDCIVWLNGHYLGNNLSGYSEFTYDITDVVGYNSENVVVVRVDATMNEGWFYEGAGIYRHVWLVEHASLHTPEYGTFVWSQIHDNDATVNIESTVINQAADSTHCSIEFSIEDEKGNTVASGTTASMMVGSFQRNTIVQKINIHKPLLWSIDEPHLYSLVSKIKSNDVVVDRTETTFGIRSLVFDKDRGFFLNGKRVEIKGVCCHQDHAGVGSALPDRLQYYRIEKLKAMGVNAYRTSHNPPTKELLEACDKLGMLVLDENRLLESSPEFIGQFERLILRDRNHPSVFLWSIGNEEWLIQGTEQAKNIALSLIRTQRNLDPSRTCTYAGNNGNQFEGINSVIPVRGFNYINNTNDVDAYHKEHPDQPLLGTEEASTVVTRGIYTTDSTRGYLQDYDLNRPPWGATAEQWWKFYSAREWLEGAFAWTGFDYRGEPTPFTWPCINSHFGIMDVCGFPKNHYYYYQAWWRDIDVLHISPHWNWQGQEGKIISVWCHSNCESVELFLNGKSLGRKEMENNSHLEWNVPYSPGKLEAHGIRNGKKIVDVVETTGEPTSILLTPDRSSIRADGEDLSIINISVIDKKGLEVPTADNEVQFSLLGKGKIIGVGNGDPSSHERDKCSENSWARKLFNGKCQIIVQASRQAGMLEVKATSQGLQTMNARVEMRQAEIRPFVSE
jgi:beta-galactosidase